MVIAHDGPQCRGARCSMSQFRRACLVARICHPLRQRLFLSHFPRALQARNVQRVPPQSFWLPPSDLQVFAPQSHKACSPAAVSGCCASTVYAYSFGMWWHCPAHLLRCVWLRSVHRWQLLDCQFASESAGHAHQLVRYTQGAEFKEAFAEVIAAYLRCRWSCCPARQLQARNRPFWSVGMPWCGCTASRTFLLLKRGPCACSCLPSLPRKALLVQTSSHRGIS